MQPVLLTLSFLGAYLGPIFAFVCITVLLDGRFAPFQACYTPKQLSDYAYTNFHGRIRSGGDAISHAASQVGWNSRIPVS